MDNCSCTGYLIHPFEKWIEYHFQCARSGLFSCEEIPFKQSIMVPISDQPHLSCSTIEKWSKV
jgi:hypothetical protein